jgi:hypothetical protein
MTVVMPAYKIETASAYKAEVFIGGNLNDAIMLCRSFADDVTPVCVTVEPVTYCYVGGSCEGVRVGLINYARFPKTQREIWETALALAHWLKQGMCQGSFTVQDHEQSYFFTTRKEDGCE